MKTLYKVFNKGLVSPYQGMKFELGKDYQCTDFDSSDTECSKGFYATDWDGLSYAYRKGKEVYEVVVWGKEKELSPFKRWYEFIKIIKKLTIGDIKKGLKENSVKAGYNLYLVSFPKNPLIGYSKKVTKEDIENLKKWAIVRAIVRASVGDSVGAYISGLFPNVQFKHDFSSLIKLWNRGIVPSFDGKTWRLHSGKKADVIFQCTKEELEAL